MTETTMNIDQLMSIIERVENLEEEKSIILESIKDIYSEAKSNGYDPKILKKIVAERKKDPAEIEEEETLLDVYRNAIQNGKSK